MNVRNSDVNALNCEILLEHVLHSLYDEISGFVTMYVPLDIKLTVSHVALCRRRFPCSRELQE